jgi:hypothetical protein
VVSAGFVTCLALLASACGGSPSGRPATVGATAAATQGSSSATSPGALAFSSCMRSNGVTRFPDPDPGGAIPKVGLRQLGVSSSQFQAAENACKHLLPTGGSLQQREVQCARNDDCPPALLQQWLNAARKLARCMRSHGVPNFPDPSADSSGVVFNISEVGISDAASHSPRFMADLDACGRIVGDFPESFG